MTTPPYDVPVLYLVFNRPEHTRQSFEAIRARRPTRLFVAADGPREHVPTDHERTEEVRRIATTVDWPCEVKTLFRRENLGAAVAVSQAVTWFFSLIPEGIILEDDCVPNCDFWDFCRALLPHYRGQENVMAICGANFQNGKSRSVGSHYLSRYPHCWGWASWRRAWQLYDHALYENRWVTTRTLLRAFAWNPLMFFYWSMIFTNLRRGRWDAWDYRWYLSVWRNIGLAAIPDRNLVTNIGFGEDATHTKQKMGNLKSALPAFELGEKLAALDGAVCHRADLYYDFRHLLWPEFRRLFK